MDRSRTAAAKARALVLAAALPSLAGAAYAPALAPGDPVPAFEAATLDGGRTKVAWEGAKLNLVNLWATWCAPCREEMPALEKLRARFAGDGLRVIGVVVNDRSSLATVRSAAAAAGVRYTVVVAPTEGAAAFRGATLLPTTYLLDLRGRVVRKYVGTGEKELEALARDVADYLAGRPLGPPYVPEPEPPKGSPAPRGSGR